MVNLYVDLQQVGEIAYALHVILIAEVEEPDLVAKKAPLQMTASVVGRGEGDEGVAATHEADVHVTLALLGGHVARPRSRGVVGDNVYLRGEFMRVHVVRGEVEGWRGGEGGRDRTHLWEAVDDAIAPTRRGVVVIRLRELVAPRPDGDALIRPAGRQPHACAMHIPAGEERTLAR